MCYCSIVLVIRNGGDELHPVYLTDACDGLIRIAYVRGLDARTGEHEAEEEQCAY